MVNAKQSLRFLIRSIRVIRVIRGKTFVQCRRADFLNASGLFTGALQVKFSQT